MLTVISNQKSAPQIQQTKSPQDILQAQKEHAEFILSVYETKLELVEDDNEGF